MRRFALYSCLLAAIGLTAASAVVHGRISRGWNGDDVMMALAPRLQQFPDNVGPWRTVKSDEMSKAVIDTLQCAGYLNRRYANEETGESLTLAVMLGPAGPIAVHSPEVCYSSRSYRIVQPKHAITISDSAGANTEFWQMTFESTRLDKSLLQVMYGWSTDGNWMASENPRISYAGQPFLLKIQLAAEAAAGTDLAEDDPCGNFLKEFVPQFQQHVFGP